MPRLLSIVAVALTLAFAGTAVQAQGHPTRLVVGVPPGGPLDNLARALAEQLRMSLNEPVLVENKPGASTRLAIDAVKNARADGKTILIGSTPPFVLFPMTYSRLTYDVDRDFVPLAHLAYIPMVLSTGAQQPFRTLPEYVTWLRQHTDQGGIGLTNLGGTLHFSVLSLAREAGLPLSAVSYRGGAPLVTDLIGGHIPAAADALAAHLELHRTGKVRILAVAGPQRVRWLPDVPTFKESGYKGFDHANASYAAFVPAGTPKDVTAKLEQAVLAAMKTPAVRDQLERMGLDATGLPGAEVQRVMQSERSFWRPVVAASGFKSED
jgi:tripartite-type tricarboxylate transporter receptor subunit TctC